ncbi:MAG: 4-alpha-glucanotransferase [Steroidobacterales bacterium]
MDDAALDRLARLRGIGDAYHDYRGQLRYFSRETKAGILRAMGAADEGAPTRRLLPPVAASNSHRIGFDLLLSGAELQLALNWTLILEDGHRQEGSLGCSECPELWSGEVDGAWLSRRRFELPAELPAGYHDLDAAVGTGPGSRCRLIIAPVTCYEPPEISAGGRLWGVTVQLYTLRSRRNWGIGDFGDLTAMIRWLAPCGAGFIGLNPLHALAPADPRQASPYSASNRHFLNVLYIAVPDVVEFSVCPAAQRKVSSKRFTARLDELRARDLVDYAAVAKLKLDILQYLYDEFRARHLANGTPRAARFRAFVAAGGELLERHARFDAIDTFLHNTRKCRPGWMNWPDEYRDPQAAGTAHFAAAHRQRVEFFLYLQWLAHEQLHEAQALARSLGMPIGLYGDYAVGANPSGSETWSERTSYRLGAEIGAPPDPLALRGQGWGIPPQDPQTMQNERMQGFVSLVRDNMRHYGAMRFDHVMSLFRLWWVPAGMSPTDGAYVHYPLHLLFAVVALESQRNRCLVVGEDLGVVPDEVRAAMPQYGLYHYKVMLFEKDGRRFRRPADYQRPALATVTTHDLPTLRSYWESDDIALRERLHQYPDDEVRDRVKRERDADREDILEALRDTGLAPAQPASGSDPFSPKLAQALHLYLARSAAALASLQLEDLLGMIDPVNVPGTSDEYPNWQRKMSEDLETIGACADLREALAAINAERAGRAPPGTTGHH